MTIQAGPATGTPAVAANETPGIPAASTARPPATVAGPGVATSAPGPATPSSAQAQAATPVPTGPTASETPAVPRAATVSAAATSPLSRVEPRQRATHDGLMVEILEVERDWRPTNLEGSAVVVQPGLEVTAVHVQVTSQSAELRFIGGADLILVDPDGGRYAPRPAPLAREPRLLQMPVLGGDVVRGWLSYVVPSGTSLVWAQWSPSRPDRPGPDAAYALELPRRGL